MVGRVEIPNEGEDSQEYEKATQAAQKRTTAVQKLLSYFLAAPVV